MKRTHTHTGLRHRKQAVDIFSMKPTNNRDDCSTLLLGDLPDLSAVIGLTQFLRLTDGPTLQISFVQHAFAWSKSMSLDFSSVAGFILKIMKKRMTENIR